MFRFQDIQVFAFSTIPVYVMMTINTWDWVHFWIYLLKYNPLSHQILQIDSYKQGQ